MMDCVSTGGGGGGGGALRTAFLTNTAVNKKSGKLLSNLTWSFGQLRDHIIATGQSQDDMESVFERMHKVKQQHTIYNRLPLQLQLQLQLQLASTVKSFWSSVFGWCCFSAANTCGLFLSHDCFVLFGKKPGHLLFVIFALSVVVLTLVFAHQVVSHCTDTCVCASGCIADVACG